MGNLLFSYDNLSTFIYIVQDKTLLEVAKEVGVPPSLIIYDNNLTTDIRNGMALYIKRRGKMISLTPELFNTVDIEKLKSLNKTQVIFPFQYLILD